VLGRSLIGAGIAALALLAAGCGGGGHSPGVATVGSQTTTVQNTQSASVRFARCMRSHGIPGWPDPEPGGVFDKAKLRALGLNLTRVHALENGPCPPPVVSAPSEGITAADQLDYLKGAACMRRHGVPSFPDPIFENGNVKFNPPPGIDKNSPTVLHAISICQKLIPAGLPYSGTDEPTNGPSTTATITTPNG
jgi:hypothetical protein